MNFLTMCTLSHATKVLEALENSIPPNAAELLLPAARRAVEALHAMQDGFFIRNQLGTQAVELQLSPNETRELTVEDAAARYLKVLRDATHGHGADKESAKAMTSALLAHHNGHVPHEIGLLGYLYLLYVLSIPNDPAAALSRWSLARALQAASPRDVSGEEVRLSRDARNEIARTAGQGGLVVGGLLRFPPPRGRAFD